MWKVKSPRQVAAGYKRRTNGQQFENIFSAQARCQGIHAIKMPLGCERRGRTLIQIKTPFDWILVNNGIVVFVDCKSLDQGQTISYSFLTPHQVNSLEAAQHHGCQSGYIVWFKKINAVVFFDATKLRSLRPGESLNASEGIYLGGYENMALGNLFV